MPGPGCRFRPGAPAPGYTDVMNVTLDRLEARVIGSLMEKSMTTPDQYPLSLNALTAACNQKSAREPVMSLTETQVTATVEALKRRYLVREQSGFGSRVRKFHYRLCNDEIGEFRFSEAERAVICLLLLRGPQTPGELRSRAGRLHEFADVTEVERTLEALAGYEQGPFVRRLARELGRRESRYAECFSAAGDVAPDEEDVGRAAEPGPVPPAEAPAARLEDRVAALERRVLALEGELAGLRGQAAPPAGDGGDRNG